VIEPTDASIEAGLRSFGVADEVAEWRRALADHT
jgi:hypothetical protein